jgi:hypothetical protein
MEVKESLEAALAFYNTLLGVDSSNSVSSIMKAHCAFPKLSHHPGNLAKEGWRLTETWKDRPGSRGALCHVRHLLYRGRRLARARKLVRVIPAVRPWL